ncbi:MAG: GWxTD domain-containing protein [Thermoanaerobaculia bacterium]
MTMRKAAAAVVLLAMLGVGNAWAQLSEQYLNWADGPVKFLMTNDDVRDWKKVRTDAEAEAFVSLFWARRDPSPATPENEMKRAFDQRVELADQRFTAGRVRGALTDRGKVLILIGPPTKILRNTSAPTTGIQTPGGFNQTAPPTSVSDSTIPTETWLWEQNEVPQFLHQRFKEMEVVFVDQNFANDYKLGRALKTDILGAMKIAQGFYQFQPDLKEVPQYTAAAAPVVENVAATEVKMSFTSAELEKAWKAFKELEKSPYENVHINVGEFVTSEGEYFVPVQVYMTRTDVVAAAQTVEFFGVVENADGTIAAVYEVPVTVADSKGDVYVDKSLKLEPGTYTGTFGIAIDDKPIAMAKTTLELKPIPSDAPSISRLILSNNIYALTEAQLPTDPYAFGGIKVVPKGDRLFSQADELWYFFELRNPGLAPTSVPATKTETTETGPGTSTSTTTAATVAGQDRPKIQVGIDVTAEIDGKKKRFRLPLTEVQAQELKGVPGHYAVGSAIPLAGFEPGTYTMEMKVIDTVAKQTYNLKDTFTVVKQ